MARKEPEEGTEEEFRVPDFDEDQYIHRELTSFRTTGILFAWGIAAAVLSWVAFFFVDGQHQGWFVGLALCAAFGYLLKFLFRRFRADIRHFGRKEWMGTGLLFFFTWLAFFILLINPPVSDFAEPRVDAVVTPAVQGEGGNVSLDLFFADNDRIDAVDFRLWRGTGEAETTLAGVGDLDHVRGGHYRYVAQGLPAGLYHFYGKGSDPEGKFSEAAGTFNVKSNATVLRFYPPAGGAFASPADAVAVDVDDSLETCKTRRGVATGPPGCVRDVRLVREGGEIHLKWNPDARTWQAYPTYAGWVAGANTFRVEAETADQFEHFTRINGTILSLPGTYTLDVPADLLPTEPVEVKVARDPNAPSRNVPGPGLPLLAAGLLAVAALARRGR